MCEHCKHQYTDEERAALGQSFLSTVERAVMLAPLLGLTTPFHHKDIPEWERMPTEGKEVCIAAGHAQIVLKAWLETVTETLETIVRAVLKAKGVGEVVAVSISPGPHGTVAIVAVVKGRGQMTVDFDSVLSEFKPGPTSQN